MNRTQLRRWAGILVLGLLCATPTAVANPDPAARELARQILNATGTGGGLVVHLGCGEGRLTAALRAGQAYTVQGLDADAKNVEAARRYIQSLGLYGPVSAEVLAGTRLPYVDSLVRLLVAEDLGKVPMDEVLRVVAPLGIAYVKQGGTWTKTVKPWPDGMDEWQQHFHGADNNAVAHDRLVGPPRRYQWTAYPEWMRSHMSMPSITSMVSARGRLFTIEDQASAEHPALPGKVALVARDAYSGIVLWQQWLPDWHPITIHTKNTPVQLQRRLAAIGDVVYCTPGYTAPVTAFDAASGKILRTYKETGQTTEFVYEGGVLYVVIGDPTDTGGLAASGPLGTSRFPVLAYGPALGPVAHPKSTIAAIEADSGRTLWSKSGADTEGYQGSSLAVCGRHAVYATAKDLVCLDRASGREAWRVAAPVTLKGPPGIAVSLVVSQEAAYLADSKSIRAFSLKDGAVLWEGRASLNHHKPPDVFLAAGVVWSDYYDGHDPRTGQIVKTLAQKMTGPMGHDRCYRNRITERYYINTKTGGSDFLDFQTGREFANPWVRSTCGIGHLPCNGLLYCGPPACSCCNWVMLNALNALAPEPGPDSPGQMAALDQTPQLEKGPAYGAAAESKPAARPDDWPTYRHDPGRSGVTKTAVAADLKRCWQAKLSTRPSAPVIAAGRVFVADVDAHAVCAFDAADGRPLWTYTTGARVDSPPTFHEGILLFGSRDGWVYALRASDGALAWRFRGLPDRMICAYEQVESAWPVCGSVMVKDGVAYFAAGRNSFLDGGLFVYGLEPHTGRVLHHRRLYGPYDADGYPIQTNRAVTGTGIEGCKADIFLTDGRLLYLRQQAFEPDLTPLPSDAPRPPHLIPSPGFLEAIPHHRTFWTIDTTLRYDIPTGQQAAHGDIMVLDGDWFCEVRGYRPARISPFDPREGGYTLLAALYRPADKTLIEQRRNKPAPKTRVRSVAEEKWTASIPLTGKAIARAGGTVFVAGTPVAFPSDDLAKGYEGRMGGVLWGASAETGEKVAEVRLDAPPVWDGLAAAAGRLYIALLDGRILCLGGK